MDELIFVFDSFTYANKAKKMFSRLNIETKLIKRSGDSGCEYAIAVDNLNYYTLVKLLRENGIPYRTVRSSV